VNQCCSETIVLCYNNRIGWGNSIEMQIRSDLVYDNMSDWDEYFYS